LHARKRQRGSVAVAPWLCSPDGAWHDG